LQGTKAIKPMSRKEGKPSGNKPGLQEITRNSPEEIDLIIRIEIISKIDLEPSTAILLEIQELILL